MNNRILFSEVDADLRQINWRIEKSGYAAHGRRCYAHWDVCVRKFGVRPARYTRELIDHEDRNKLNNQRDNIRIVSYSVSNLNRSNNGKGVYLEKRTNRWRVSFCVKNKMRHFGTYATRQEALLVSRKVKPTLF
jgi:hypothetical protein